MADTGTESGTTVFSFINIAFVIVGVLLIYYLYRFLQTPAYSETTTIIQSQQPANVPWTSIPKFPQPYEGGDYSINTWLYVNSLNTNNKRKHVFQIQGSHFSTLLMGIGPYKNSLFVRTHYADIEGFQVSLSDYTSSIVNRVKSVLNGGLEEGFQQSGGTSAGGTSAGGTSAGGTSAGGTSAGGTSAGGTSAGGTSAGGTSAGGTSAGGTSGGGTSAGGTSGGGTSAGGTSAGGTSGGGTSRGTGSGTGSGSIIVKTTNTPNSYEKYGNLSTATVDAMFQPMASDDSLLKGTPALCDLPEIDLQRWTMVTVVISGKIIDVYVDGKLTRSCAAPSYFKVDPTKDVTIKICDRGGFDGYIGNTSVANYSMNPDEIYRTYLSGPSGVSLDLFSWFASLLKGAQVL